MIECCLFPPFKVLLVDDEEKVLGALKRSLCLIDPCIKLSIAHGGDDAIKVSKQESFDLIISDLRMPKTDGSKVLGFIRRNYPDSFRVILSGQANIANLLQALPVSHQYLEKPCSSIKLASLIKTLAKLRSSKLPVALLHQILTISSLQCDGRILLLLREELEEQANLKKLNTLFNSDLSISVGLLRLTAITCGGSLPHKNPFDVGNLPIDLLKNLLESPLLLPLFQSEENLRAIRIVSIKSILLRQQLMQAGFSRAKLLTLFSYLGELALIQTLGVDSNVLSKFADHRDEIAQILWNLWAMPEDIINDLKNNKIYQARNRIDLLFPSEEMAQISNAEMLEIYSEVLCLTD